MTMVSLEESCNCGGRLLLGGIWAQMGLELDGGISPSSKAIQEAVPSWREIKIDGGQGQVCTYKHQNKPAPEEVKVDVLQCH